MRWEYLLIVLVIKIHPARLDFNEELNILVGDVTKKYFQGFKCVIYITDDNSKYTSNWSLVPPVVIIFLKGNTHNLLTEIYNMDCEGFIVRVMDRVLVIKNLIKAYKASVLSRYNNKKYIFLPVDENDNHSHFLEIEDMYYMPHLVFAAPADNSTHFEVIVHNYFNGHKYDILNKKTEVIDIWYPERGFERDEILYPNRMGNLYGKEMIFALINYSPYSLVIKQGGDVVYDGLETRIAAQFAASVNATWTGKDHPITLWGDLFENGSANGVLGSVYDQTADLGFGALYQWHCDVLECSYPYLNAAVTCLVPKPLPISGWYTIILPFKPNVWGVVFFTYLLCSFFAFIAVIILRKMKRVNNEQSLFQVLLEYFFVIFRIQFEQSIRETGSNIPLYTFFKICTIYCFFIAVCWQAGISSFLTVPRYEDPIDDAEDLTSRWPKIEWGANHIDWIKSIEQSTQQITAQIARKFVVLDAETLKKRVKLRNFGYFIEQLPKGHYGFSDYIDEEGIKYLRIMKNNIYTGNCVIILPRCSPYLESLDQLLFRMTDTGLMQKLEIQISLERINNRLQKMIRTSADNDDQKDVALLVSHISGVLFIYGVGIALSTIVFLWEILYHKYKNRVVFGD